MYAMDTVKVAAKEAGVGLTHIGVLLGKSRQYVNSAISSHTQPNASRLSSMLRVCGYELCAVRKDDVTDDMMVID